MTLSEKDIEALKEAYQDWIWAPRKGIPTWFELAEYMFHRGMEQQASKENST